MPFNYNTVQLDQMPIIQIENDTDDQLLVLKALVDIGVSNPVVFFQNGQQALNYLRTVVEQPLMILCDIEMPIMDGFELRNQIDKDKQLRERAIPFIFFSTWVNQDLLSRAYAGTIQGYHLKGLSFDDLKTELALIVAYWKRCLHPRSLYRTVGVAYA